MVMSDDGTTEITARGAAHRGELWVRAPNIMKGYWKRPDATRDTLTPDGWLKTGDIAYVDDAGKFYIVDRKKELIKVKGHQVAPAELEALLRAHPAIADAAVIGVPTPHGDEAPRAYIVRQPHAATSRSITPEAVQALVATNAARHKRLTGGVRWVDAIPRDPSGKILRRQLKERAKEEDEGDEGREGEGKKMERDRPRPQ
jgi:4-coumarate--CoA ligase